MSSASPSTNFQRRIGLGSGVAFVVGIIIGSGIFISPKGVFANAQCSAFWALVIWGVCGLFSMIGSVCYAELGTTIVRSGGDYAYIKAGLGSVASFLYLWLNIIVIRPASQAILALTFAYYLIGPFWPTGRECSPEAFEVAARLIAAMIITVLGLINAVNVKWTIHLQNVFTFLKVAALLFIVVVGIGSYLLENLTPTTTTSSKKNVKIIREADEMAEEVSGSLATMCEAHYSLSIYSGLFAFGGWNYLNIVTDELKDPYKNLPRAALVGIFVSSLIYILVNIAYFAILTPEEILTSPTIALTFARKMVGPVGVVLISLSIATSALGALNATIFTTSRLFCIGAQEEHLPAAVGMLHYRWCTPVVALVMSVVITYLMLFASDVYQLINYFSFTYWLWTGVAVISGVYLRLAKPDLPRPIRLPLAILYFFIALCLLLTALAIENDPLNSTIGFGLVLAGLPVYGLKLLADHHGFTLTTFTNFLQKLFLVVQVDDFVHGGEVIEIVDSKCKD